MLPFPFSSQIQLPQRTTPTSKTALWTQKDARMSLSSYPERRSPGERWARAVSKKPNTTGLNSTNQPTNQPHLQHDAASTCVHTYMNLNLRWHPALASLPSRLEENGLAGGSWGCCCRSVLPSCHAVAAWPEDDGLDACDAHLFFFFFFLCTWLWQQSFWRRWPGGNAPAE